MQNIKPCRNFLKGYCKFGVKCYFSHEKFTEIFVIRHAQSQFNKIGGPLEDGDYLSEEAKLGFQTDPQLIDCKITPQGANCAKSTILPEESIRYLPYNRKKIDLMFTSPLQRALQTAHHLIQGNDVAVTKIIVLPQLTQVLSKICDLSQQIQSKMQRYPQFDFSEMYRYIQQYQLKPPQKDRSIFSNWQDALLDKQHHEHISHSQQYGRRYLKILSMIFPKPMEDRERCFQRSMKAMDLIKRISQDMQAEKILVVSHNRILKYMLGRKCKGRCQSLHNCQIKKIIY